MYTHTNCPVCKGKSFSKFLTTRDYTVSQESFDLVTCEACAFVFTNPIPDLSNLGGYYKSQDYISHSNTRKGLISRLYHWIRRRAVKEKLKLVSNYVSRGTILDYGSGTGSFLDYARTQNWKAFGLEPDKGAREIAFHAGLNVSADKKSLEEKTRDLKFNAITLWHVLEHVTDLEETLGFFKEKLAREGILVIAVPNHKSYDANYYKQYWAAYDVPRHLYHFDLNSIQGLLSPHGYKLVGTYPMKFDSFYVSMLSEKYKTGSINYFKAFLRGLESNLNAKAASDYSSVIYVFQ